MASVDPTFGLNNFNKPKVLSEAETYVRNILTILFGKPGFYPSIPELGMDIRQYLYQFSDNIDTAKLKSKLAYQCDDFLPLLNSGDMEIYSTSVNEKTLLIFVLPMIIDETSIALSLGVTINAKGEMVYNFMISDDKQYI